MTRYRLSGIDSDSGLETELTVEARDERHARMLAATNGIEHAVVLPVDVLPEVCPIETIVRPRKRKRWLVGAAIFVVAGLTAGGGWWWWWQSRQQTPNEALVAQLKAFIQNNTQEQIEQRGLLVGFRGIPWGSSRADVKRLEPAPFDSSDTDIMIFSSTMAHYKTSLIYIFAKNQLVRAKYYFTNDYANPDHYIDEFNKIAELLETKYGKADYIEDVDHISGLAIAAGKSRLFMEWYSPDTNFCLSLSIVNSKPTLQIEYLSVNLSGQERQQHLDGL